MPIHYKNDKGELGGGESLSPKALAKTERNGQSQY